MSKANEVQVGGDHYRRQAIQPWDYIAANGLDFFQGAVVKYISRWKTKDGIKDLEKCLHFLQKYIEVSKSMGDDTCDKPTNQYAGMSLQEIADRVSCSISDAKILQAGGTPVFVETGHAVVTAVIELADSMHHAHAIAYGSEVMPGGYAGFIWHGANADGYLYQCKACRESFTTPHNANPHRVHVCIGM